MINKIYKEYKIGVIDSGRGGQFITQKLQAVFPEAKFIQYRPYTFQAFGSLDMRDLQHCINLQLDFLRGNNLDFVVIGCMTASVRMGIYIRESLPYPVWDIYTPVVYNLDKGSTVVCTPNSVPGFKEHNVIPCMNLAFMIESNYPTEVYDRDTLKAYIYQCFYGIQYSTKDKPLLLGCTHYYSVIDLLEEISGCSHIVYPDVYLINALLRFYGS